MELRLLIVEDRPEDAELAVIELLRAGYQPDWTRVDSLDAFVAALEQEPDVVLCDYSLPSMTAPDALAVLRERELDVPLIVLSGVMDEDTCVSSLRQGAVDYLLKDRMVRLGPAVAHALEGRRLAAQARLAEAERRRTEAILSGVLDWAPAAVHVRDLDGGTLLTNARYDLMVDPAADSGAEAAAPGPGRSHCEKVYLVNGDPRTYLCVSYPIADAAGQAFAIGTIGVDISEQKEVEAQLREVDRLKGELVASVSHELRTPLTSICGYAEMLLGGPAGPARPTVAPSQSTTAAEPAVEPTPERRMLEVIERNGRRLLGLVDDLLTLSRVDAGHFGQYEQPVDLGELVRSGVGVLTPSLSQHRIRLDVQVPEGLPPVPGDRSQLERVVLNLLTNAVKFSEPEGVVTISLAPEPDDERVRLSVVDRGIGITPEEMPKLFTRFFRSDEARRRVIQGTGLGLAVVKEIVDRHGGEIVVDSAPGAGTTVTVRLSTGPRPRPLPDQRRAAARPASI